MNRLIGEINSNVQKNVYTGGTTPTATVNVDNVNNIITVNCLDTNLDTQKQLKMLEESIRQLETELAQITEKLNNINI